MNKRLIENIISLFLLQGMNYVLPLLVFPFLVRTLGIEPYGVTVAAAAFMGYFMVLTDYGFNLTATRQVAVHKEDKDQLSRIYSSVMTVRVSLLGVALCVLVSAVWLSAAIRQEWEIYLTMFLTVVGNVLFPVWLYQGMERMKVMTGLNMAARVLSVASLFLWIREPDDVVLSVLIQSLGSAVPGMISVVLVRKRFGLCFVRVDLQTCWSQVKDGFSVFLSGVSIVSYTSYNSIIIGLMLGSAEVALFGVALKMISAFSSLSQPLLMAMSPKIAESFHQSLELGRQKAVRVGLFLGTMNVVLSLGIFGTIGRVVPLVFGDVGPDVITYVRMLSLLPLVTTLSYVIINILMLNEGLVRYSFYLYLGAGLGNVIFGPVMLRFYEVKGLVGLYGAIELLIMLGALLLYLNKRTVRYGIKHSDLKL